MTGMRYAAARRPPWSLLLALLAGALYPLGMAPLHLWPLCLVSVALLLALLQGARPRDAALRGFWYGLGVYGAGTSWVFVSIHEHGPTPAWLAALLTLLFVAGMALFFALHGYLAGRLLRPRPASLLLGFPALWVVMEWFRSWFLTGFPWIYLGYAPLDTWLAGWAPLGGVYALSFLVCLSAASLVLLLHHPLARHSHRNGDHPAATRPDGALWRALGLVLLGCLPWLAGWGLQQQRWTQPAPGAALQVSLVQGNIPQVEKWDPGYRLAILDTYLQLTDSEVGRDLIVWPETAIVLFEDQARYLLEGYSQTLKEAGSTLISGVPFRRPGPERPIYHNSILAMGDGHGLYHKQRLVPFGEYVPLENALRGLIRFFDLPMSSFTLGPPAQLPLQMGSHRVSASICYEIVYPDLIAAGARQSDLLLTISNDSWFGDSWAPWQHQQMARMRALENGRYLVRATNNGISALIGPQGELLGQSAQFQPQVLRGKVHLMQGVTPYSRWGSLPLLAGCFGLLLLVQLRERDRRPR